MNMTTPCHISCRYMLW